MAIDFTGLEYDANGVKINLADLHINTWVNAFNRVADHVFGNESIAKASTARAKDATLSDEAYEEIKAEARKGFESAMIAGTWGDKGRRGPRMPAANRLEAIYNAIAAADTRIVLAAEYKQGTKDGYWIAKDGNEYPLADWMKAFLTHPTLGEGRQASIQRRAEVKYEAEKADAAERKAAKERESKVERGTGLSL